MFLIETSNQKPETVRYSPAFLIDCKFAFVATTVLFTNRGALNITRSSPRNNTRSITMAIANESVIPIKIPNIAFAI